MRLLLLGCGALLVLAGCRDAEPAPRPPISERARDSIIGSSALPGAQGVRGALRAADSAQSRRGREDSIASSP
jgi:hypothetical protein